MVLRKTLPAAIPLALLLLASCRSVPKAEQQAAAPQTPVQQAPLWLTADIGAVYNSKDYLAALGEGTAAAVAQHDALNKLSQYFETTVHAEGVARRATLNAAFSSSSEQTISVTSNADLFCVEYDHYYNELQNRYYTVAFIHREKAFNFVKPKLEIARTQFPPAYQNAVESDSLLDAIIGIKRAQSLLHDFYEVYDFARAILPEKAKVYEAVDSLASESALKLKSLAASVLIKIEGVGNTDLLEKSGVVAELSAQFKNIGFVVGKSLQSNCLALVEVKSVITETPNTFETYPELSIKILEKGAEKISYVKKLPKVAGFDRETVIRRTNSALTKEIRTSFVDECF